MYVVQYIFRTITLNHFSLLPVIAAKLSKNNSATRDSKLCSSSRNYASKKNLEVSVVLISH